MAVSKVHPVEATSAYAAGQRLFGENAYRSREKSPTRNS
jgi:uncharacterized pyridoxal phosphate-containing UPF0001 family protein